MVQREKQDQLPIILEEDEVDAANPTHDKTAPTEHLSTKAERQEFFLPVTGFLWLYPEEVDIVNHPAFQRLSNIYQLGQAYLVYRGATHKRIEHVLGAVHIIQRMIDAVRHTSEKRPGVSTIGAPLSKSEERFARLGALLHDIGHLPAGHTVEDELCLVGHHDADQRLNVLFDSDEWKDKAGKTLGELTDERFHVYVPDGLRAKSVSASQIVRLLIRKAPDDPKDDKLRDAQAILLNSDEIRFRVCTNMIGNTICADLLDYLHRDWYHVGKPRPFDERILQYMEIRTESQSATESQSTDQPRAQKAADQFVLSLGKSPKIRTDAVSEILELLEWRYQLGESVLFHRTKLSAAAMLDRALYELWHGKAEDIESTLLPLSDEQLLEKCIYLAENGKTKSAVAARLLRALKNRQLFAEFKTYTFNDLTEKARDQVKDLFGKSPSLEKRKLAPEQRMLALQNIEQDFRLPPGTMGMYCGELSPKVAEVAVAVGDEVSRFCDYERTHNKELSGGHLDAQLHRFERLWRVHFFIDRKEMARLQGNKELMSCLYAAIDNMVVNYQNDPYVAQRLARVLVAAMPGFPYVGKRVLSLNEQYSAARRDPTVAKGGYYPSGCPCIRSFIVEK